MTANKGYNTVICVTGGDGYEKGKLYAQIGWNNGVHILRETESGDVYDREFCSGGIGVGCYNDFNNTGAPSFDDFNVNISLSNEVMVDELRRQLEAAKAHAEAQAKVIAGLEGENRGLRFAIMCDGVSGADMAGKNHE